MRPVGFVGLVLPGTYVDGRSVEYYVPGKHIRAIAFSRFLPECTMPAANDAQFFGPIEREPA